VFENPAHDFPQQISYWLADDEALDARIAGTVVPSIVFPSSLSSPS